MSVAQLGWTWWSWTRSTTQRTASGTPAASSSASATVASSERSVTPGTKVEPAGGESIETTVGGVSPTVTDCVKFDDSPPASVTVSDTR